MARNNYFNTGDHFSEFHRKFDGIAGVDIDFVEICKECQEPLAFFETAMDKGQTFKTTTVTEKIAIACDKPAFLVFYTPGPNPDDITNFRITKIAPTRGLEANMEPLEFIRLLKILQSEHWIGCVKNEVPF